MNGKRAKLLRGIAESAGKDARDVRYIETNVREKPIFSRTKLASNGLPEVIGKYTTRTLVTDPNSGRGAYRRLKKFAA